MKDLSQRVAHRLAQLRGDPTPEPQADTHRIENPRQHDIARILAKEEAPPAARPHIDNALIQQLKSQPPAPDYSHARNAAASMVRDAERSTAPRHQKISPATLKALRSSTRPRR